MLTMAMAIGAFSQDTEKKVVVHPDGSYTVIEYPLNKEVVVNLLPMDGITGSMATAKVARVGDGTKIYFDVNGGSAEWKTVYAYAVDANGMATMLGPITFSSGAAKAEFMTPLNQFMLVLSPMDNMSMYDNSAQYVYRSEAPKGYAIVPRRITDDTKAVATAESVNTNYSVPMLGVPKFEGKTTEVRVKFDGELSGLDGKAYLKPQGGKTTIKMRFGDMRKAPLNTRFVLWASSPDGSYTKIGQVINTGSRDEAEIRGETALTDFGLLITIEDADVDSPTGRIYAPLMR